MNALLTLRASRLACKCIENMDTLDPGLSSYVHKAYN